MIDKEKSYEIAKSFYKECYNFWDRNREDLASQNGATDMDPKWWAFRDICNLIHDPSVPSGEVLDQDGASVFMKEALINIYGSDWEKIGKSVNGVDMARFETSGFKELDSQLHPPVSEEVKQEFRHIIDDGFYYDVKSDELYRIVEGSASNAEVNEEDWVSTRTEKKPFEIQGEFPKGPQRAITNYYEQFYTEMDFRRFADFTMDYPMNEHGLEHLKSDLKDMIHINGTLSLQYAVSCRENKVLYENYDFLDHARPLEQEDMLSYADVPNSKPALNLQAAAVIMNTIFKSDPILSKGMTAEVKEMPFTYEKDGTIGSYTTIMANTDKKNFEVCTLKELKMITDRDIDIAEVASIAKQTAQRTELKQLNVRENIRDMALFKNQSAKDELKKDKPEL